MEDRAARNKFMIKAHCTRQGKECNDPNPLYFASPVFFQEGSSYPLSFLSSHSHTEHHSCGSNPTSMPLQGEDDYFPSLGNLLGLVLKGGGAASSRGDTVNALTYLCDQAAQWQPEMTGEQLKDDCEKLYSRDTLNEASGASGKGQGCQTLLQDIIDFDELNVCGQQQVSFPEKSCRSPVFNRKDYEEWHFNWRWLNASDYNGIEFSSFNSFTRSVSNEKYSAVKHQGCGENCNREAAPNSDSGNLSNGVGEEHINSLENIDISDNTVAIVLGVEGGGEEDRFDVPHTTSAALPGASLHALQAIMVQDQDKRLNVHSIYAVVADFCIGILFLAIWEPLSKVIKRMPVKKMKKLMEMAAPPAIAFGLFLFVLYWVSPGQMGNGIWLNPAYVLLGLVLHAYSEAFAEHRYVPPDFTFGVRGVWGAYLQVRGGSTSYDLIDAMLVCFIQWAIILCAIILPLAHH
jgi:hypothetical protein